MQRKELHLFQKLFLKSVSQCGSVEFLSNTCQDDVHRLPHHALGSVPSHQLHAVFVSTASQQSVPSPCTQQGQELVSSVQGPSLHSAQIGPLCGFSDASSPPCLGLCFCDPLPGTPSSRSPFIQGSTQMSSRSHPLLERAEQPSVSPPRAPRHCSVCG